MLDDEEVTVYNVKAYHSILLPLLAISRILTEKVPLQGIGYRWNGDAPLV
jgi:hypothetical protein